MFGLNKYLILAMAVTFLLMSSAIAILWYMNESKSAKIAVLEIANTQLKQNVAEKEKELELSNNLRVLQEKLLIRNRTDLEEKDDRLRKIEEEFSSRKDSNDVAPQIFKDYFQKLRGGK